MSDPAVKRSKVTLGEVARAAGVSPSAASKALNGRPDVSETTRRLVLDACEKLGYSHRSPGPPPSDRTIALVADNIETTYTLEILKGAATAAMRLGTTLALFHLSYSDEERPEPEPLSAPWARRQKENGVVGVITVTTPTDATTVNGLGAAGLAHVAIDPATPPPPGTVSIGATNWNGGVAATQHLISLGHRRIAFVKGPTDSVPCHERFEGYMSALRMNGIRYEPGLVQGHDFSYENGLEVGRALLSMPPDLAPTAVFTANDTAAIGVYEAARELGIRIPEDLSVIGFDDTDIARWATPALTTVHQPLLEMGAQAVHAILSITNGEVSAPSGPIQLLTRLVERNSTASAPAGDD